MSSRTKRGFTLVELLVVIAIIGILVALTVPAVNMAVNVARKNSCLNNQRGIGQAMQAYLTDKEYYPGYVSYVRNDLGEDVTTTWMGKLLPYLDQQNLADQIKTVPYANRAVQFQNIKPIELEITSCPSDPDPNAAWRLSYAVNTGVWDGEFDAKKADIDLKPNGVFFDLRRSKGNQMDQAYITSNDGIGTTIMLSENVNSFSWLAAEDMTDQARNGNEGIWPSVDETLVGIIWMVEPWVTNGSASSTDEIYAINYGRDLVLSTDIRQGMLSSPENVSQSMVNFARPSSRHSGGVNIIFCDGRGQFLSDEIDWTVYTRLMTPAGQNARHAHDFSPELKAVLSAPISADDLKP